MIAAIYARTFTEQTDLSKDQAFVAPQRSSVWELVR
jgi:hypothetical protein